MMAQVLENHLINKMMINWAKKTAPEDRQATEDVLDAMTQYRLNQEALSSLRTSKEQQDNLELLPNGDHVTKDDLDEARRPCRG